MVNSWGFHWRKGQSVRHVLMLVFVCCFVLLLLVLFFFTTECATQSVKEIAKQLACLNQDSYD